MTLHATSYLEDAHEFVGAEVGLSVHQDPLGGPVAHQLPQHPAHGVAVLADACGELAVAPCPSAALSVAQIGLWIEYFAVK